MKTKVGKNLRRIEQKCYKFVQGKKKKKIQVFFHGEQGIEVSSITPTQHALTTPPAHHPSYQTLTQPTLEGACLPWDLPWMMIPIIGLVSAPNIPMHPPAPTVRVHLRLEVYMTSKCSWSSTRGYSRGQLLAEAVCRNEKKAVFSYIAQAKQ